MIVNQPPDSLSTRRLLGRIPQSREGASLCPVSTTGHFMHCVRSGVREPWPAGVHDIMKGTWLWYIVYFCWSKKSCTTPVTNGIFTISTGAGFLPSTVVLNTQVWKMFYSPNRLITPHETTNHLHPTQMHHSTSIPTISGSPKVFTKLDLDDFCWSRSVAWNQSPKDHRLNHQLPTKMKRCQITNEIPARSAGFFCVYKGEVILETAYANVQST